jgi:hypothetical protein
MTEKKAGMRVWIFSVLGMLLIRLLAHGPAVASPAVSTDTAHAETLNQTIPTMTPTGHVVTPPTTEPTKPLPTRALTKSPPTQGPTQPPPEPTDTAIPTASLTPSPTGQEGTRTPPTATAEATVAGPSSPTATPPLGTEATPPRRTGVPTESQTPPLLTQTPTASPSVLRSSTSARSIQTPSLQALLDDSTIPTPATSRILESPCLWISLGLVFILAGIVVLVRQRSNA